MQKPTNWLRWIDNHILKFMLVGYIFLIPLYFKLPAFHIEGTYIHVRLEDFYNALFFIIFAIQVLRRRVSLRLPLVWAIGGFWAIVFLSFVVHAHGILVQTLVETIAQKGLWEGIQWYAHSLYSNTLVKLSLLHALRRVEYMLFFFIAASLVRTKDELFWYLRLIVMVFTVVCIYAIGQKFLQWPAVQTMNPEFSKGYIINLEQYARASSTFAGHYDLAGYLVLLFPVIIGLYLLARKGTYAFSLLPTSWLFVKRHITIVSWITLFAIMILGIITLILTASRVSYIAYFGAVLPMLLFIRKPKLLASIIILTIVLTPISDNLKKRINATFTTTSVLVNTQTGTYIEPRKIEYGDDITIGSQTIGNLKPVNENSLTEDQLREREEALEQIRKTTKENIYREASRAGKTYTKEELEAEIARRLGGLVEMQAGVVDVSFSVRLQKSWPNALLFHFLPNPFIGDGPSTVGEATDGNYVRMLAEFGLLGFLAFLLILFGIMKIAWEAGRHVERSYRWIVLATIMASVVAMLSLAIMRVEQTVLESWFGAIAGQIPGTALFVALVCGGIVMGSMGLMLLAFVLTHLPKQIEHRLRVKEHIDPEMGCVYYGFIFGTIGLMINALAIDIFEASKVAYTFWMLSGMIVGSVYQVDKRNEEHPHQMKNTLPNQHSALTYGYVALAIVVAINGFSILPAFLVKNMPPQLAPQLCPLITNQQPKEIASTFVGLIHNYKYEDARTLLDPPSQIAIEKHKLDVGDEDSINPYRETYAKVLPSYDRIHAGYANADKQLVIKGFETTPQGINAQGEEVVEVAIQYADDANILIFDMNFKRIGCEWIIVVE